MKTSLALFAALLLATSALAQDKTFSTIFRHTCEGAIEIFPTAFFGAAFTVPYLDKISQNAMRILRERADCLCPDYNEDYFNLMFNPIYALTNGIRNESTFEDVPSSDCLRQNLKRHLLEFQNIKVNTPDSCTYESIMNSGTCLIKEEVPDWDITLKLAVGVCKNGGKASFLPHISIHCEGGGCSFLTQPCESNNDCPAASTCLSPFEKANLSIAELPAKLFEGLQEIGFYGPNDQSPGCYQAPRGNGAKTPENDIPTRVFTFFVNNVLGINKGTITNPKFCINERILDTIINSTSCHNDDNDNNDGSHGGTDGSGSGGISSESATDSNCVSTPPQFSDNSAQITVLGNTTHCMAPNHQIKNVNLPYLESWDGKVYGTDVFQTPNDIPPLPSVPTMTNAATIARITCDGAISIGRNEFGLRFKDKIFDILNFAIDTIYDLMKCRLSPELTKEEFIREYGTFNPAFWLYKIDKNAAASQSRPQQNGWDHTAAEAIPVPFQLTNLPISCNLENWLTNKRCDLKFTGLRTLTLLDIDIGLRVQECPSGNGLPSIDLLCLGTDCANLFEGINTCDTAVANSCPSTMQCVDVINELKTGMKNQHDQDMVKFVFDTDLFDFVLGPRTTSDVCDNLPEASIDPTTNPSMNSTGPCNGPQRWRQDIHKFIVRTFGRSNANENGKPLNFCIFNHNVFDGSFDFEAWAKSLVTTKGNDVTLNAVSGIIINDDGTTTVPTVAPPTDTPTPSNAGRLNAVTALILATLLAFLFAFQA